MCGGFSKASSEKLAQPMVADSRFGSARINVANQQRDPESLLASIRKLACLRRAHGAIGSGSCSVLDSGSEHVLAHAFKSDQSPLLFLHNLHGKAIEVTVDLGPGMDRPKCLLGGEGGKVSDGRMALELEAYGLRWFEQDGAGA